MQTLQHFIAELQRRKVLRVAATYLVGAWIVLQVAVALQTAWALSSAFSGTILNLMILGFPVALGLTWFFEITPQGIKRTTASADGAPLKLQTTDFALAGALALVFVVSAAQLLWPRATAPATETATAGDAMTAGVDKPKIEPPRLGDKSVAVLPFANLSPDKENEYFADGLTEELLNLLAKIGDLKVISRTSSFAFKGKETPLPEIAKLLGVRHVIEGSVRASGEDLRITAQLIDVTTDTHLWSQTYERKISSVFALQTDIARDIAGALKVEVALADSGRVPTTKLDAYRLYLQARALHARRGAGDLAQGVEFYKRAIELDPKFADAHAALATNYAALAAQDGGPFPHFDDLARQSANTALRHNPKEARAYGVLATLARQRLDWVAAMDNFAKAIKLDPADSITLATQANALSMVGECERARPLLVEAERLDPIYSKLSSPLKLTNALACRDDAEAAALARGYATHVDGGAKILGLVVLTALAREGGAQAEAERNFREAAKLFNRTGIPVDPRLIQALKTPAAFGKAAEAIEAALAQNPTLDATGIYAVIGDYGRFFDALDTRIDQQDTARFPRWMPWAWRFANVGSGAGQRFKSFAQRIGLVDYWKKHGWPDRCRAKGEDDFECN